MVKIGNKNLIYSTSFLLAEDETAWVTIPGFAPLKIKVSEYANLESMMIDDLTYKHLEGATPVYSLRMLEKNEVLAGRFDTFVIRDEQLFMVRFAAQGLGKSMLINFQAYARDVPQ